VTDTPRGYWDELYRSDPDYFGPAASSLARSSLGVLTREASGARLIELGCGTGRDLCYFAQHGFQVRGCDLSEVAARIANARLASLRDQVPPAQWVRVADTLEYLQNEPPGSAEVVYSNLYLNLEVEEDRLARLIAAAARVLRPEGWLILSVRSTTDPWFGRGEPRGDRVFVPGEGRPPLRFFAEGDVRRLAGTEFEVVTLREHPDGDPEFPIVVWSATMRRRR
jgi:SAM-dependent methyltransferase